MLILLSNDDGVNAPGIQALSTELRKHGELVIVAPESEQSTVGHSLTLHKPIRVTEVNGNIFAVAGSPADCVHFALKKILKRKPDLIFSGINMGANLGNDIHYSGTVAAAREGTMLGIQSIAMSITNFKQRMGVKEPFHFESAFPIVKPLMDMITKRPLPHNTLLNVNIPNLPFNEVKGIKAAKQGFRIYSDEIIERADPRHNKYYWIGGTYQGFRDIEGSDCNFVDKNYITITPVKIDSTDYTFLEELKTWDIPLK